MRAVDTNVVVRLLARDDDKQTALAEKFVDAGAWVSTLVLAESVWVLESVYALSKLRQLRAISMLLEHQKLVLQDSELVRAALVDFGAHRGVSFSDCLLVAAARDAGHTPVGTFDKKLSKLSDTQSIN